MLDKEVTAQAIYRLEETIAKANAAAERLVRCAESISNPVYSVSMQGHRGELQIQAVRHFQGQICITVANPFAAVLDEIQRRALPSRGELIGQSSPRVLGVGPKCSALYGSSAEGDCPICGNAKSAHDGSF